MEMNIGERIAYHRKAKGYTQEQLGELVGVSGQAVSKWENGGVPDAYLFPAIAGVLEVSIDALFGVEKKIFDRSPEEMLDQLFQFFLHKSHGQEEGFEPLPFLLEATWAMQSAYFGNEKRPALKEIMDYNRGGTQISSQIIDNKGATYFSLSEKLPFACVTLDSPALTEKILEEKGFGQLFSLLAAEDGLKAVLYTQSVMGAGQYTAEKMAERMQISPKRFQELAPRLIRYGLLRADTLTLDGQEVHTYRVRSHPTVRPLLVLSCLFIHEGESNGYYGFSNNRTSPLL